MRQGCQLKTAASFLRTMVWYANRTHYLSHSLDTESLGSIGAEKVKKRKRGGGGSIRYPPAATFLSLLLDPNTLLLLTADPGIRLLFKRGLRSPPASSPRLASADDRGIVQDGTCLACCEDAGPAQGVHLEVCLYVCMHARMFECICRYILETADLRALTARRDAEKHTGKWNGLW
jgi:hypothetical protein